MTAPLCDICGKPASQYPNWILSHGEQMHVGCAMSQRRAFKAALNTIAYETIGHSEATLSQVYNDIVEIARNVLEVTK